MSCKGLGEEQNTDVGPWAITESSVSPIFTSSNAVCRSILMYAHVAMYENTAMISAPITIEVHVGRTKRLDFVFILAPGKKCPAGHVAIAVTGGGI